MKSNINFKKAIYTLIAAEITSFTLLTTGCSSKQNYAEQTPEVTTEIENSNDQNTNENDNTNTNNEEAETSNEDEIVKYFKEKQTEINNTVHTENGIVYTENIDLTNAIWSDFFIDAVDIIFYDKEYEGSSFSKLNPEAQQECLNIITDLGNTMNRINPDWQSDLGNIKDSTASAYYNFLASIKDLIGEDLYNKIKGFKDSIKDSGSEIWDSITDTAEEWYQDYKSKNK